MVEFQYFEGCPHAERSLENLNILVSEGFLSQSDISLVKVKDAESAERLHFAGSPTILCNGIDVYTLQFPDSFSFSCRIYEIEGTKTGILATNFLKSRIDKILSGAMATDEKS